MSPTGEGPVIPIERIIDDSRGVTWAPELPYHRMYRAYLTWFANLERIGEHEVVLGASVVYAWMPRQLAIDFDSVPAAADALEAVRNGGELSEERLRPIITSINRSVVGASKYLHFLAPERFAIVDSNVVAYLRVGGREDPRNGAAAYLRYCAACRETVADARFVEVQRCANEGVGYRVSALRAVELVMYLTGVRQRGTKSASGG